MTKMAGILRTCFCSCTVRCKHRLFYAVMCFVAAIAFVGAAMDPISADHVRDFSCGKLFYRTFYLDAKRDALYIGAMDRIIRVNLTNISHTSCERDSLVLEPSNVANCVSKGKSEQYECRNHVRVIQPMGDGSRLYVCGTNAHNPKDWVIYANLSHLPRQEHVPGIGLGVAKCPYDPSDNSTAVWVERGNPGDLPGLYSGTNAEFTKADTVIFRTDLYNLTTGRRAHLFKRTIKYDSKWLDKPDFVGSYDMGEHVLFFFRETAVEYINCGKNVYSRVARVCKQDTGGKNILGQNWATYLKARLNCSIPGEFPFYFNEIQGIYKVPGNASRFHAVFTTSTNGLVGSAICSFTVDAIQEAFRGKFKEQATSSSAWLPVLSSKVPEPRPGECVNDTQTLPDTVLNFIRSHPLMDEAVAHEGGKPVFYRRDLLFTHLVVDVVRSANTGREYTVYYAGTNIGKVYKIVQWFDSDGESRSRLLDTFDVTTPEPIRAMEISSEHRSLYVASDSHVRQVDLVTCRSRYDNCLRCVHDPYCGWDRGSSESGSGGGVCRPYSPGYLQDPSDKINGVCDDSVVKRKVMATWGQSVHLACPAAARQPELTDGNAVSALSEVMWVHHGVVSTAGSGAGTSTGGFFFGGSDTSNGLSRGVQQILYRPDKYIQTSDRGLVILTVTEADAGRYDCRLRINNAMLCSYNVTVDAHRCSAPSKSHDYQKIYSDWCHEFEKYKAAMKGWERRQAQCSKNGGKSAAALSQQHPHHLHSSASGEYHPNEISQQQQQQQSADPFV